MAKQFSFCTLLILSTVICLSLIKYVNVSPLSFSRFRDHIHGLVNHCILAPNNNRTMSLGTIDQKQPDNNNCSAKEYRFNVNPKHTIFKDHKLWEKCGINSTAASPEADIPSDMMKTKCGITKAILISRKYEHRRHEPGFRVPNIVHYVLLGKIELQFLTYISIKSADKFLRPSHIFVHGDGLTYGYWWARTLTDVHNVYFVRQTRPIRIQGQVIHHVEIAADVLRLQIMRDNGGMYLDTDVIVVRSFNPLRRHPITLGRVYPSNNIANGIIIAQKHAPFLCLWDNGYRDYNAKRKGVFLHYSVRTGRILAKMFPWLVRIENETLFNPSNDRKGSSLLLRGHYDWSKSYAVHVWHRPSPRDIPQNVTEMDARNSTIGELMRRVYYD